MDKKKLKKIIIIVVVSLAVVGAVIGIAYGIWYNSAEQQTRRAIENQRFLVDTLQEAANERQRKIDEVQRLYEQYQYDSSRLP